MLCLSQAQLNLAPFLVLPARLTHSYCFPSVRCATHPLYEPSEQLQERLAAEQLCTTRRLHWRSVTEFSQGG